MSIQRLLERVGTSVVLLGGTALVLFRADAFWFGMEVALFSGAALYEFLTLLKKRGIFVYRLFGLTMGLIIPVIATIGFGFTQSGEVLFIVLGCLFLFILQFFRKDNSEALLGISLTLFGILYVSWFLSFVIKLRFLNDGALWVAYLVLVTKSTDVGAYLVGTVFGKHSLIAHISPKKSVEGTLAGLVFSTGVSLLVNPWLPEPFGIWHAGLLGLFLGTLGQIGDLSESLMKRFCEAKDSSQVFPGMGGVLDTIDSILFTAPIFYYHLRLYL